MSVFGERERLARIRWRLANGILRPRPSCLLAEFAGRTLLILFLLLGALVVRSDDAGNPAGLSLRSGTATIIAVSGFVEYSDGNQWHPAVPGTYPSGVSFRTATNSDVDLRINRNSSITRVLPESLVAIPVMRLAGPEPDPDSETMIDLEGGGIMDIVGPISANSRYEIKTPKGVVGGRGPSQFVLTASPVAVGPCRVSVSVMSGEVVVSAVPAIRGTSAIATQVREGKSFDLSEPSPKPADPEMMNSFKPVFDQLKKEAGIAH
jgi:hypothetical protein